MKVYFVKHITDCPIWENIEPAPISNVLWTEDTGISAQAQVCWDEQALYVRLTAWEENIRAEHSGQMCSVWEDSCLEFFICPIENDDAYFNIEFNPNCALMLGCGRSTSRCRLTLSDEQMLFSPVVERFEHGWSISYTIPVLILQRLAPQMTLYAGKTLRGNFYKCGDKTVRPHYLAWNPVVSDYPEFHLPEHFGVLVLSE